MDQVKKHITRATELTALNVWRLIQEQGFTPRDLLTEEESIKREKLIDQAGVDAMATAGEDNPNQATPEEVAKATVDMLLESVPKDLPGIVFLSGGQSPDYATENLNVINKVGGPWQLSYSYARALQGEPMEIWAGKEENVPQAQKAFSERGKKVSLARQGKLS